MKKLITICLILCMPIFGAMLTGCNGDSSGDSNEESSLDSGETSDESSDESFGETSGQTLIFLSDYGITVDGNAASEDTDSAVYVGADIIYYEEGHDSSYGEGTAADEHSPEEAASHTVVTITQPGDYNISGTLSAGQIFVDLGEDSESDPDAVVTLYLDNMDITCTVAPAILFYRTYECSNAEEDTGGVVDTSAAGSNAVIVNGTDNYVQGSYVARIYKEGTTKKLHKYDGAFYSRMTMNIDQMNHDGENDTGYLFINAENEGLDSELHLTINGGYIEIVSQDDAINTNEDYISTTTINAGTLYIDAGNGTEGDGIDSNGYLTINGGTIISLANGTSGDGGLDADMAITINGGTIMAFGRRNDSIDSGSTQPYMELAFASTHNPGEDVVVTDTNGNIILSFTPAKVFQSAVLSLPDFISGNTYYLYVDGTQQQYSGNLSGFNDGGMSGFNSVPDGFGDWYSSLVDVPADIAQWLESLTAMEEDLEDVPTETETPGDTQTYSVDFVLEEGAMSFSGISDSPEESGKTTVTFTVNDHCNCKW